MSNPPTTLGKYQIIREIARSNDIVYEAYDPLMNRRVALKELAVPGGSTSQQKEERLKRFLREAKAAGSLAHPNIVTIYEVGEDAGRHYLVMEYLDGHTLRNELDTHGFLPADRAIEIAENVLRGLEYAHQNGVIHRDIKPENIQLLSDGRIKLTDFGIARLTFEPNLTMDGQVFGTPSYMSPEQVVGRDIDARSDLFSVGVVLYEMLAGQKPFTGDSVVAITYAIMNKEPEQPQQVNFALWQVLNRVLDKSPQMRFASSADMLKALDSAAQASSSVVIDPSAGAMPQPSLNPYDPALLQGQGNPFLQNVPIQQPYVPGGMPVPVPPPIQYPYNPYNPNPYGPTGGAFQPGMPPPGMGGPGQTPYVPIPANVQMPPTYYAPPKKPLLSPTASAYMRTTFLVVLSLALLFLVVIVMLMYFTGEWHPTNGDQGSVGNAHTRTASNPGPAGSNAVAQPAINGPQGGSPDPRRLEEQAVSFEQTAQTLNTADAWDATAAMYENAWKEYDRGGDTASQERCMNHAASARYTAYLLLKTANPRAARQDLYSARDDAPKGSDIEQQVQQAIGQATGA